MLSREEAKIILFLTFLLLPLFIQNPQEEVQNSQLGANKTNHGKEKEALLQKAMEMGKLLNKLRKEKKPDKEKYFERTKKIISKPLSRI